MKSPLSVKQRLQQQQQRRQEEEKKEDNKSYKVGFIDLYNVVQCLGESCPWTASVSPKSMLKALNSEICELYDEIDFQIQQQQQQKEKQSKNSFFSISSTAASEKTLISQRKEELIDEIGDILFDALMIELVCRREYNIGPNDAWDAAITKIKRRTPYMKEWNNGLDITATTVEECEVIWKAIKKNEPKKEKLNKPSPSPENKDNSNNNGNNSISKNFRGNVSKTMTLVAISGFIGFSIGVLFSRSSLIKSK